MRKINKKEVSGGGKITKQISLSLKSRIKSKEICKAGDKNLNKPKWGNTKWFHQNDSHNIHWLREKGIEWTRRCSYFFVNWVTSILRDTLPALWHKKENMFGTYMYAYTQNELTLERTSEWAKREWKKIQFKFQMSFDFLVRVFCNKG